jgi:2-keto-4-pentenoate hydratase
VGHGISDPRVARGMEAQRALFDARIAAGAQCIGWKVGFGAPAALAKMSLDAPLVGFLTDRAVLQSGAVIALDAWKKPAAEPEITVHLGADVGRNASRAQIVAAIAGIGPAIELADVDFPPDDVETILAGNIYQRHVVFGRCDATRAGGRLDGLVGRVIRNGVEIARTEDPQALTGELIGIVRHVADTLAACDDRLRAGQRVITGSIVPPLWITPGEEVVFALDPVDTVSVRFSGQRAA